MKIIRRLINLVKKKNDKPMIQIAGYGYVAPKKPIRTEKVLNKDNKKIENEKVKKSDIKVQKEMKGRGLKNNVKDVFSGDSLWTVIFVIIMILLFVRFFMMEHSELRL